MVASPDTNNGFRPALGQVVRIVGHCHPRVLGTLATVTEVDEKGAEVYYADPDDSDEMLYSWGEHGGLEPVDAGAAT